MDISSYDVLAKNVRNILTDASVLTIGLVPGRKYLVSFIVLIFFVIRICTSVRVMIRGGCLPVRREDEKIKRRYESDQYGNKCVCCEAETATYLLFDCRLYL